MREASTEPSGHAVFGGSFHRGRTDATTGEPRWPRAVGVAGRAAGIAGVAAPALFVVWQYRAAQTFADQVGDPAVLRFRLILILAPYLSVVATGVLAARTGHRWLAVLAPFAYVGLGWVGRSTMSDGVLGSWAVGLPSARLLGLAAALAPCVAAAFGARPSRAASRTVSSAVGLALVGGAVGLVIVTRGVIGGHAWDTNIDLVALAVIAGLVVSSRLSLIPVALAIAVSLPPDVLSWIAAEASGPIPFGEALPFCLIALACASHRALAALVDHLRAEPLRLFLAVNVLNVADALATYAAVRMGAGSEANPVVAIIGLPAKVVVGLLASALIRRYRPEMLLVPLVALAVVLAWHVIGLLII